MNKSEGHYQSLYRFQDQVLAVIQAVDTEFYLTGGTAASRGYLHHRYSDDLDFFVNDDPRFQLWADRLVQGLHQSSNWQTQVLQREERFVRINLIQANLAMKVELINDVPARVGSSSHHPILGRLDSAENILANKISALIGRDEPKDVADVWGFCCQSGLSIQDAIGHAAGKAAGIFPADLARRLLRTSRTDWETILWINRPVLEDYLRDLSALGESLLGIAGT